MKHFATGDVGGAGLAALRAHESLIEIGITSSFVSPSRLGKSGVRAINSRKILESRLLTLGQRVCLQRGSGLMTSLSLDLMGELPSNEFLIHVHAFYNLFSMNTLIALAERGPIFVTMHDLRLITGGCHYSRGCRGYLDKCSLCPQARRVARPIVESAKEKSAQLLDMENLRIISPSRWIANLIGEIHPALLSKISVVRNPIPELVTKFDKDRLRIRLGIDKSDFVVGFVSTRLDNPLKGGDILMRAIDLLPTKKRKCLRLLLVGEGTIDTSTKNIKVVRTDKNVGLGVRDIFSAMDVLVVPSIEDNLPNVIGESLMAGTPVIGSNVGGIPEVLKDFDMPIVSSNSAEELTQAFLDWQPAWSPSEVRLKARSIFGYKTIGTQLKSLYQSEVNSIVK